MRDAPFVINLGVVSHTPQETIDDTRFAASALGNLARAAVVNLYLKIIRRALDDYFHIIMRIKIQMKDYAEAPAQRSRNKTGAVGRADESKFRKFKLDEASASPLPY